MQDLDHQKISTTEAVGADDVQGNFVLQHMHHNLAALPRADKPLQQGSDQARSSPMCHIQFSAVLLNGSVVCRACTVDVIANHSG